MFAIIYEAEKEVFKPLTRGLPFLLLTSGIKDPLTPWFCCAAVLLLQSVVVRTISGISGAWVELSEGWSSGEGV